MVRQIFIHHYKSPKGNSRARYLRLLAPKVNQSAGPVVEWPFCSLQGGTLAKAPGENKSSCFVRARSRMVIRQPSAAVPRLSAPEASLLRQILIPAQHNSRAGPVVEWLRRRSYTAKIRGSIPRGPINIFAAAKMADVFCRPIFAGAKRGAAAPWRSARQNAHFHSLVVQGSTANCVSSWGGSGAAAPLDSSRAHFFLSLETGIRRLRHWRGGNGRGRERKHVRTGA